MKRLTQRMSILMILVLSFAFVGIANATDWYVDFFGNNGNDGRDPGLPLRTINKAIEKAFDGDVIYIAYANGNDYEPIDGSIVPGGDNDLIFRSTGGDIPNISAWTFNSTHTIDSQFRISGNSSPTGRPELTLQRGSSVVGAENLIIKDNAIITQRGGTVDNYFEFETGAKADFILDDAAATLIETGKEFPDPLVYPTVINNLTITRNTPVKLNSDIRMNGIYTNAGVAAQPSPFDLDGHTVTVFGNAAPTGVHDIGRQSHISNGLLHFILTGDVNVTNGNTSLPDILIESSTNDLLTVVNAQTVGKVTTQNSANALFLNTRTFQGISSLGTGILDIGDPVLVPPPAFNVTIVDTAKANSPGALIFNHDGRTTIGSIYLKTGLIDWQHPLDNKVLIKGNTNFIDGKFTIKGDPTPATPLRVLQLAGDDNRFSNVNVSTDFSDCSDTEMLVKPENSSGVTSQVMRGYKQETVWFGPLRVDNNKASGSYAVTFRNGTFRILGNVTFQRGQVKVADNNILIGGQNPPMVGTGDFDNTSGYEATGTGFIIMNGNTAQNVQGNGIFGNFGIDNPNGVQVIGANTITFNQRLHLTDGDLDNGTTQNINFNNTNPNPTIVRDNGKLTAKPNFISKVNVIYRGGNDPAKAPADAKDTDFEFPDATVDDKLQDFSVETTSGCSATKGGIYLTKTAVVHGNLNINVDQVLFIRNGASLSINSGTATLNGTLVGENANNAWLILANPTGTVLTAGAGNTMAYLPSIRVADGSSGNKIIGFKGLAVWNPISTTLCDLFNTNIPMLLGDLIFDPNTATNTSSLDAEFAAPGITGSHLNTLSTEGNATLTLLADMNQLGNLSHKANAHILINEFTYSIAGATIDLWGSSETMSDADGALVINGVNPTNLNLYQGSDPVIDANVEVNLNSPTSVLALLQGAATPSNALAIQKNFTLRQGKIQLGAPAAQVDLTLLGDLFHLYGNGSFDTSAPGILYLNPTNPPMNWHIYNGPTAPSLNHLTVQNSVNLREDDNQVIIQGNYLHQMGTVDLGTNDLVIEDPTATFTHVQGDYLADTGWLWLRSSAFNVGSNPFSIPNFRINNLSTSTVVAGTADFTVEKRLDLYSGIPGTVTQFSFDHKGLLQVSDGTVVRYHSGTFLSNGVPTPPGYAGSIHLRTTNDVNRNLPTSVWPAGNPDLVQSLEVLTATSDPDPVFTPAPANPNALDATYIQLADTYQLNGSLLLRNGRLVVGQNQTLTFADDLEITRVDGAIVTDLNAQVNSSGTGYEVTYQNNGNWDVRAVGNNAPFPAVVPPVNPPTIGNAPDHIPYVMSGLELPSQVKSLAFTRHRNFVNKFTVINKPVTIKGSNTLYIHNNISIQANATMTVLSDVYFLNESGNFALATDPVCEFWSPLVFAGGENQTVYVPKDGIDIRPPQPGLPVPPPIGPARIMIAKDYPENIVNITGGNLRVDHISFCNGLLDTDDDSYIHIPAPAPGMGQGFDRDCMQPGNISHIIGRVTKRFMNAEIDAWSSNERQEFPVGSRTEYRPMAFTFRNVLGQVTIPHNLELTAQHIDTPPRGDQGIPIADNCGVETNTYTPFFWFVETNGTYTQEPFDLEVKAAGLERDTNPDDGIDGYHNVDDLRILRRHGTISEVDNTWLLQGNCADYDNAQYDDGPTVINEYSRGGLRTEGAIFTVGMPYGDLPVAQHFADKVVWDGNPYNAMTFYITRAEFYSGKPLQPGDEVGIYDGQHCVGFVKLAKEATRDNYAIAICSKDDDPNDGVVNGYTDGNKIYYRLWDSKTDTEYMVPDDAIEYYEVGQEQREFNVVFEQRSTRVELLEGEPRVAGQEIWLTKGWNIFSLAVDPTPPVNLFDVGTPNIFGQGILNPIEPQLKKVQDEEGNTIEIINPAWQNYIGDWQETEGYYIKVTEDVLLQIQSNTPLGTPITIDLRTGWNIISYPCLESQQDALDVLQDLIDTDILEKAMDQYGHALEKLAFVTENNGWYNGIGTMKAGQGYYIKVKQAVSLEISCPGQNHLPKLMAAKEKATPKHFIRERGNPYMPMNFYISSAQLDDKVLAIGDEIAVYDGDLLVGSVVVDHDITKENPLPVIAAMDDGSGNGFAKGNSITFKVWKAGLNQEIEIDPGDIRYLDTETGSESGSQAFAPQATATVAIDSKADVQAIPQAFELSQNYPNPFNPSTMITFAIPNESNVTVQVYDITGKLVATLIDTRMPAGYHNVEWTGTDSNGLRVATGIYFYKMTAGNFVQTKKMLFAK